MRVRVVVVVVGGGGKTVISLENIQIHRYTLEPVGTVFLRWCLLFPSRFFGDFFGILVFTFDQICRYADQVCPK